MDLTKPMPLPFPPPNPSATTTVDHTNNITLTEKDYNSSSSSQETKEIRKISEEERLKLFDDGAFAYDDDIGTDEISF